MLERLRRSRVVRLVTSVHARSGADGGGYLAASIAYYGFLALFPLLLLGVSVVGFVLAGNPGLAEEIVAGLTDVVPGVEAAVGRNLQAIQDARAAAGVIGVVGLVWTGMGLSSAARNAVVVVFREERFGSAVRRRLWLLWITALMGVLVLGATAVMAVAGGLEAEGLGGAALRVGAWAVAFGLDLLLFLTAYRLLLRRRPGWGSLLPGAVLGAAGWGVLKIVGAWYAELTVARSVAVYGTLAAAVGALVLLYLAARVFVYGAELNALLLEEREGGGVVEGSRREPGAGRRRVPTIELAGQVATDVGALIRAEVQLARQEMTSAVAARAKAVGALAVVAVIALYVVGFLGAAAAAGLAEVMPPWAGLLIVAGAFVILAAILGLFAVRRLRKPAAPERATRAMKEDVAWARTQIGR